MLLTTIRYRYIILHVVLFIPPGGTHGRTPISQNHQRRHILLLPANLAGKDRSARPGQVTRVGQKSRAHAIRLSGNRRIDLPKDENQPLVS